MVNLDHPVLRELDRRGFKVAVHIYVYGERVKAGVAAKHSDTGELLQGRCKTGDEYAALLDVATRAGLDGRSW